MHIYIYIYARYTCAESIYLWSVCMCDEYTFANCFAVHTSGTVLHTVLRLSTGKVDCSGPETDSLHFISKLIVISCTSKGHIAHMYQKCTQMCIYASSKYRILH